MTNDEQRLFDERADRLDLYRLRTAELETELAEARKDGERLEWLMGSGLVVVSTSPAGNWRVRNKDYWFVTGCYDTPRAAIDAARGTEMTAAELEALAERLQLGEYTTADLHAAARCAREYGQQIWRAQGPRWMKCPTCKKNGFRRKDVWEPFSKTGQCKCQKCGSWATVEQWTAIEAVEGAK